MPFSVPRVLKAAALIFISALAAGWLTGDVGLIMESAIVMSKVDPKTVPQTEPAAN